MVTTLGQTLVNDALPEEYKDHVRTLTKDEADALLVRIAKKHPDKYRELSHHLMTLGAETAFLEGSTLKLSDLLPVMDKQEMLAHVDQQEAKIDKDKTLTPEQKEELRDGVYAEVEKYFTDETYKAADLAGNPFARQVKSKARGNKQQLAMMLTTPSVYQEPSGKTVPLFIRHSYSEGLSPAEYWAATHGARTGLVSTKLGTRQGGYLGKQLGVASITQIVTKDDCGTPYGMPVPAADQDNIGSVLARPVLGYPAGTVIDKELLAAISKQKVDTLVVRSPVTCSLPEGLCKICVGRREDGDFPQIGANIGLNASSAIAERIAQGSLNQKHTGKRQKGEQVYSGFPVIEELVQVPSTFPNRAAVSTLDGTVDKIAPAPQGGTDVFIDGAAHHVPQEMTVMAKVGDKVEQGDQLSSGVINPAEVVQYKGVGEGRRYFTERFTQALRDSKFDVNRRNVEVLARALINNVEVTDTDGAGSYLPGDIVHYQGMASTYKPRTDAKKAVLKDVVGQYLEEPALHYTVGTRVSNNMVNQMKGLGITEGLVHPRPPGFEPKMVSLVKVPQYEKDWMAQLSSNYLENRLLTSVHRGETSDIHGLHPMPGIAYTAEFGEPKKKGTFTY